MADTNKDNEKEQGVNPHVVLEALNYQQTNMRTGNAAMKNRGAVRGGGAKPYRQKGTGRARQGSTRAVQWVGGGRAFGSRKHVYGIKMNKKARRAALQALIDDKREQGRVVLETLDVDTPSTKAFVKLLADKEMAGKVLLLHGPDTPDAMLRSARNVPEVTLLHRSRLNVKDLLNNDWILVAKADEGILTLGAEKQEAPREDD